MYYITFIERYECFTFLLRSVLILKRFCVQGPVGKRAIPLVSSAAHVRTLWKGSNDHLAVNIDPESDRLIDTQETVDDKRMLLKISIVHLPLPPFICETCIELPFFRSYIQVLAYDWSCASTREAHRRSA